METTIKKFIHNLKNLDILSILEDTIFRDMLMMCIYQRFDRSAWEIRDILDEYTFIDKISKHPELIFNNLTSISTISAVNLTYQNELMCTETLKECVKDRNLHKIRNELIKIRAVIEEKMKNCPLFINFRSLNPNKIGEYAKKYIENTLICRKNERLIE